MTAHLAALGLCIKCNLEVCNALLTQEGVAAQLRSFSAGLNNQTDIAEFVTHVAGCCSVPP